MGGRCQNNCKAPLGQRGDQAVVCKSHRVRIQKPRLLSSQYFIILGTPHVYTRGAVGQIMELFGIDAVVSLGATASAQNRYSAKYFCNFYLLHGGLKMISLRPWL